MSEESLLPPKLFHYSRVERLKEAQALAVRVGNDFERLIALVTECTSLLKMEEAIKRQGACEGLIFLGPALNAQVDSLKEKAQLAKRAGNGGEEEPLSKQAQRGWSVLVAAIIGLIDRLVSDKGIMVPEVAARALGAIGVPATKAIEALQTMTRPSDEYTKSAAEALQLLRAAAAKRRNGD